MRATKSKKARSVIKIATELHEAALAAKRSLDRATRLAEELSRSAVGDLGPQDPKVVRLEHALSHEAQSWAPAYLRDSGVSESIALAIVDARDMVDLAKLARTPREAVAS